MILAVLSVFLSSLAFYCSHFKSDLGCYGTHTGGTNLLAIAFPIRQSQWNRMQFNTWCRLLNFHFHFHFISWIWRDLFCSHNSIPSIRIESLLLNMRRSIRVVLIVVQWLTDWWGWKHQSDLGCDAPPSQSRRQVTRNWRIPSLCQELFNYGAAAANIYFHIDGGWAVEGAVSSCYSRRFGMAGLVWAVLFCSVTE